MPITEIYNHRTVRMAAWRHVAILVLLVTFIGQLAMVFAPPRFHRNRPNRVMVNDVKDHAVGHQRPTHPSQRRVPIPPPFFLLSRDKDCPPLPMFRLNISSSSQEMSFRPDIDEHLDKPPSRVWTPLPLAIALSDGRLQPKLFS